MARVKHGSKPVDAPVAFHIGGIPVTIHGPTCWKDPLQVEPSAAKQQEYTIHPVALKFPELPSEEFAALKESIRTLGQFEPIIIDDTGVVLDGRHRYQACRELGVAPRVVKFTDVQSSTKDTLTAEEFIFDSNMKRRHLTESQRAAIAAEFATMRQGERTDLEPSDNCRKVSQEKAGELLKVSSKSVGRAKKVKAKDPETFAKVKVGDLSLNAAVKSVAAQEKVTSWSATERQADNALDPAPSPMPQSQQVRLELAIRQHKEKLDSEFYKAVNARVEEFLEQTIMPKLQEEQNEARRIMNSRKGIIDRKTYKKILSCLDPDLLGAINTAKLVEPRSLGKDAKTEIGAVKKTIEDGIGFYDISKKEYLIRNESGRWLSLADAQFKLRLRKRGISTRKADDSLVSAGEQVMLQIQDYCDVQYSGALAGRKSGFYEENGVRLLVTSDPKLIAAAKGEWPMLKGFVTNLLAGGNEPWGNRQLSTLFGWLKIAVQALRLGQFQPGQALTFAGPVNCGKSLLQSIITEILAGRSAKAALFLQGRTDFNSELFGAEHLVLEDEAASTSHQARAMLGSQIKAITVNRVHPCHGKRRDIETFARGGGCR
jgi:ParB-like chromosome segregation protein Spo0J